MPRRMLQSMVNGICLGSLVHAEEVSGSLGWDHIGRAKMWYQRKGGSVTTADNTGQCLQALFQMTRTYFPGHDEARRHMLDLADSTSRTLTQLLDRHHVLWSERVVHQGIRSTRTSRCFRDASDRSRSPVSPCCNRILALSCGIARVAFQVLHQGALMERQYIF